MSDIYGNMENKLCSMVYSNKRPMCTLHAFLQLYVDDLFLQTIIMC